MRQRVLQRRTRILNKRFRKQQRCERPQRRPSTLRIPRNERDAGHGQREREQQRRLKNIAAERASREQQQGPQRVRVRLHALAHVPHQTEAMQRVIDYPKGNERVLGDRSGAHKRQRDQHAEKQHPERRDTGLSWIRNEQGSHGRLLSTHV